VYTRNRQKQASNVTYYSEEQVKQTLIAADIDIKFELENDLMIFCPFHNNSRSPAGEVSKETGIFWCFSCQESKELVEVIMHATKRSYFESMRLIDSKADKRNLVDQINSTLEKVTTFVQYDLDMIEKLHKNVFENPKAIEYFKSRGITKDSVERYKLGYSVSQDMVTIPVYSPDGICLGFVGRSVQGKRFKNSTNLPKSKTLFNLSKNKRVDKVFVVESSFDAIRIEQVGGHAVATLGATISKEQRRLLKQYFNQVIALGDNDEAGQNMSNKLLTDLGYDRCIIAKLPSSFKDVSDLDDERLKEFVDQFDNIVATMLQ
jgi:DNA primase